VAPSDRVELFRAAINAPDAAAIPRSSRLTFPTRSGRISAVWGTRVAPPPLQGTFCPREDWRRDHRSPLPAQECAPGFRIHGALQ